MNSLIVDKTDPSIAEAVAGCEVGVPKTLTVTVTPVSDSDSLLVAKIDSIEYTESEEPSAEPEEEPETAKAYKPKAKKTSATAVEPMV